MIRERQDKDSPLRSEAGAIRTTPNSFAPPPVSRFDPALVEEGPYGPLPVVAPDGRRAWRAYSRPFEAPPDVPRIAVVISNLGLASGVTETAIRDLPPEITLAFAPYADDVDVWVAKARAAGHEVLLDLPMEPISYPKNDPGPKALFSQLSTEENLDRLQWVLSRATGYVGVINFMGSRFTTSAEALRPILEAIRDRGLMFVDSRSASRSLAAAMASEIGLPRAVNDLFIDAEVSQEEIDRRLLELEETAALQGSAVGIGFAYPVTINRLSAWSKQVEKRNFVLASISAVTNHQADR